MASIPETFTEYEDVTNLRRSIYEKQLDAAKARKRQAEAKQRQKELERQKEREKAEAERRKRESRVQLLAQAKADIQPLYDSGLLTKLDIDLNEAWVDPMIWAALDYDTKVGLSIMLARICDLSDSTGRIVILNNKTGKKLAKHSQVWGFKHY